MRLGVRRADGLRVAIKSVPKRRALYVEMLRNEIALLQQLRGAPHIVTLLDVFEDAGLVHLVFEVCSGGELFAPIADQGFRFHERQASRIVRYALEAVVACHALGIVHRDLKVRVHVHGVVGMRVWARAACSCVPVTPPPLPLPLAPCTPHTIA